MMSRQFTFLVLVFALFAVSVSAYNNDGSAFYCENCSDCSAALVDGTYGTIYMNTTEMVNESGQCVESFTSLLENKTFDCNGSTIKGGVGFFIYYANNLTIQNCIIKEGYQGISMAFSNNTHIKNNTIRNMSHSGISLGLVENITLESNQIYDVRMGSGYAISFYQGFGNINISSNIINNTNRAIVGNDFTNNIIVGNNISYADYGIQLSNNSNTLIESNFIDFVTEYGIHLNQPSTNNIIFNNTISDCDPAIWFYCHGIYLDNSSGHNITQNNIFNISGNGIFLYYNSSGNLITDNSIYQNQYNGIRLIQDSSFNVISGNTVYGNLENGISLEDSSNFNNVSNNNIYENNASGIFLESRDNNLVNNSLPNNTFASIFPWFSLNFCSNYFENNTGGCCGKPLEFHVNENNVVLDAIDSAAIMFCGVNNSEVKNLDVHNTGSDGFIVMYSDNISISNVGSYDNAVGILTLWTNNILINNSRVYNTNNGPYAEYAGLLIIGADNVSIVNTVTYNNSFAGVGLDTVRNITLINLNSYGNSVGLLSFSTWLAYGGIVDSLFLINSSIYDNSLVGFGLDSSSNIESINNKIYSNNISGAYFIETYNVSINDTHIYNQTVAFSTQASLSNRINFNGVIFDNPLGDYANYMNVSMRDTGIGTYVMSWVPQPAPAAKYTRFNNKSLVIEPTGALTIESLTFHWTDADATGFDESKLNIWDYETSWRYVSNQVRNTAGNNITITNLNRFSIFSILNGTYVPPVIPSGGTKSSSTRGGGHSTVAMPPVSLANITEQVPEEEPEISEVIPSGAEKTPAPVQQEIIPPANATIEPEQKKSKWGWIVLIIILLVLFLIILAVRKKKKKQKF